MCTALAGTCKYIGYLVHVIFARNMTFINLLNGRVKELKKE